jgi:glutathione S-transferase
VGSYAGLYPQEDLSLAGLINSLVDAQNDMMVGVNAARFPDRIGFGCVTKEQIEIIRKDLNDRILPQYFQYFEQFLLNSSTGWLANTTNPTIADFAVVPRLQLFTIPGQYEGISSDILKPFPNCLKMMDRFYELPSVREYYESRKG